MSSLTVLPLLTYLFALWFGFYLLNRHPQNHEMRFAGLGILVYALGLLLHMLAPYAPVLESWRFLIYLLPAAFWYGAITHLYDGDEQRTGIIWAIFAACLIVGGLVTVEVLPDWVAPLLAALILVFAVVRLWSTLSASPQAARPPLSVIFTATLFFGLGIGLFLLPADFLPVELTLIAIGVDLGLLGIGVAALDAYHEGERLRADFVRSLIASALTAMIFGGQVVLVMAAEDALRIPLFVLLLAITSAAILFQTSYVTLQNWFDSISLPVPVQRERAELRQAAEAATRVDRGVDWHRMDEDTFSRMVRRALSSLGDPGKLAASPLTQLPMIDVLIEDQQDHLLERAALLKTLLGENIMLLKPRDTDDIFGVTDEWRYFNALYYPYVVGLKPYSRRAQFDQQFQDPACEKALEWFQTQIPERTLYNWQNAAARLIARNLQSQLE